jgi:hypothetical protein
MGRDMMQGLDVDYPHALLLVVLSCVLVGLIVGFSSSTVALGPYNSEWDGGSELRTQLGTNDTTVEVGLSTDIYESHPPADTVAFVLGPGDQYASDDRERLASFVSQGGTLVVASATNDTNDLLASLDVSARIDGTPVRDEETHFRSPALPRATNVADHERMRNVDALTLNHGTVIDANDSTALAATTNVSYLDVNRSETLDDDEPLAAFPVAVVESVDAGAVIVVSDGSLFTNAMLEQDGNRQFVKNLAADHERAVLDYSHSEPLPPLTYAFLVVRSTPLLQFLLGTAGIGLVALWGYGVPAGWLQKMIGSGQSEIDTVEPDEETIAAYLTDRHPDWEQRRIRRVTKVITRTQQQENDNE